MAGDRARLRLLVVPVDSGHRARRQGAGPGNLVAHLPAEPKSGRAPEVAWLAAPAGFLTEIATSFQLIGQVAGAVAQALEQGRFPVVLSGNCNTSAIGGAAGLRLAEPGAEPGLIWLDAHGDFNTPETDPVGFLDGQGLAVLTGRCWQGPARRVPGYRPLADSHVMLVGAHDLDDEESTALARSGIARITPEQISGEGAEAALGAAAAALAGRVTGVYLHIDLDIIDADYAPANSYAPPGGLRPDQLLAAVRILTSRLPVVAAGIAAYDPALDGKGLVREVALKLLGLLAAMPARQPIPDRGRQRPRTSPPGAT